WNEETYFYVHNLQGDVIGLLDRTGALVVRYTYDTWGKPLTVEGTLAETLGQKNPYRYRGYSYDGETGLYYVGARYYDPVITRWLSPEPNVYEGGFDEGAGLLAPNVYAYCANNPVILYDPSGEALMLALEGEGYLVTTAAAGGANFWNPVGWVLLGVAVIGVGYTIYQNQKYKPKAPSLPSYNKLRLNKNHIMSGHSAGGNRGGPNKDRFPKWMTWSMIQKAIQEAYNTGKRVQTQGDSVFLRGFSKTYNTVVEMWVNLKDKIIETAWPK
ncbi:RHS repeat-associated core domain-containing protein, partial [Proteiniclasticum sp. BAD-10]